MIYDKIFATTVLAASFVPGLAGAEENYRVWQLDRLFTPTAQQLMREKSGRVAIYDGLLDQGILVLSEKIRLPSKEAETLFVDMHHAFKKTQGYSELEISQKRNALDNVLIPETLNEHIQRLQQVGFKTVEIWFQCFNFISLLAIK